MISMCYRGELERVSKACKPIMIRDRAMKLSNAMQNHANTTIKEKIDKKLKSHIISN